MKRLFALRDSDNGNRLVADNQTNQPKYFSDKQVARNYRATLTERTDRYFITHGPDHKRYKGAK